ncbi:helix-turn-helix domain-containing protein [Nocardia macrotermitis]|nr:helix-turn-helix transcriptional regulator [Nocardia macrotermitis]
MDSSQGNDVRHGISCARRTARAAKADGARDHEAALAVHRHCGVSLLRAHRIVHGYTLVEAVDALKELLRERGTPAEGLAHQRMSQWECGQDTPSPHYLDALCLLYRTRPDRLGFGTDYSEPDPVPRRELEDTVDRRHFLGFAAAGATFMSAPSVLVGWSNEELEQPGGRRATTAYVGMLEDLTEQNGFGLYTTPPAEFIPSRMVDLARIEACLLRAASESARRRLHRMYAKNAGFIAIRLNDIAGPEETFEWFRIARLAAGRAEDDTVQAWVAGHVGDACTCQRHGYASGLTAAQKAQTAGARVANPAAVLGHLVEAGVHARLGRRRETIDAVRNAERMYEQLPAEATVADGVGVSEYLLRWHQTNALAAVGAHQAAAPLRERVLEMPFIRDDEIGKALLDLDVAAAEFDAGQVDQGCDTVGAAWQRLPGEFRTGQVPRRAFEILDGLKPQHAVTRAVADVRELLAVSGQTALPG